MVAGQVRTSGRNIVFRAPALGSCVAIVVWDPFLRAGGLAHVMLPGSPVRAGAKNRLFYAGPAIAELLRRMRARGNKTALLTFLIGGGNVLRLKKDTVCRNNILSVLRFVEKKGLATVGKVLGGTRRKAVEFFVSEGIVRYRQGESGETIISLSSKAVR